MVDEVEIKDSEKMDTLTIQKENFVQKIKNKARLLYFGGIGLMIMGIILFFAIKSDWSIGVLTAFIGLAFIWVGYLKFGSKNVDNIEVVEAKCVDKSRSGYRRQYFEYTFEDNLNKSFTVQTAQKTKFIKGLSYNLCFDKSAYQNGKITGSALIYHETV